MLIVVAQTRHRVRMLSHATNHEVVEAFVLTDVTVSYVPVQLVDGTLFLFDLQNTSVSARISPPKQLCTQILS